MDHSIQVCHLHSLWCHLGGHSLEHAQSPCSDNGFSGAVFSCLFPLPLCVFLCWQHPQLLSSPVLAYYTIVFDNAPGHKLLHSQFQLNSCLLAGLLFLACPWVLLQPPGTLCCLLPCFSLVNHSLINSLAHCIYGAPSILWMSYH
jgi:hypothetical protein